MKFSSIARQLLTRVAGKYGYSLVRVRESDFRVPVTPEEMRFVNDVKPYSMTSLARILALHDALAHILAEGIPGDLVECGVWRGGNIRGLASVLQWRGSDRLVWAYDTFEGMPPPEDVDRDFTQKRAADAMAEDPEKRSEVWAVASLEEVKTNVLGTGIAPEKLRFIQGKVEETIPAQMPEQIALLRLDTDWYQSTKHELEHLYPRLSRGGILIIDDYGTWSGARKAVDDYFHGAGVFLHWIDSTGVLVVKK